MTNLVDSSAWLEYFGNGPNATRFAPAVQDLRSLLVPTVTILEVYKYVARYGGAEMALDRTMHMCEGRVVDLDTRIALDAAEIGVKMKLPLADSIILATARLHDATIWTQDADFEGIEGVKYFPTVKA